MPYEKVILIRYTLKVLALLGDSAMAIHLRCFLSSLLCFLMT